MAPNSKTLFHLVPTNQVARDALLHPDNKRFVSQSSEEEGDAGLEIGYHVPSLPQGQVITRLGRNTDLILRESTRQHPISAVHVAFEINPATHLILLSVRSKRVSSVSLEIVGGGRVDKEGKGDKGDEQGSITGDGVLLYGQGSRDRPTGYDDSEYLSWHVTRLNTAKRSGFEDSKQLRELIGSGASSKVYKVVDRISGHNFAIKVVDLTAYGNVETTWALIHREIKVMERLSHRHIIDYLGYQDFDTLEPKILMPLCKGTLTSLAQSVDDHSHDHLCAIVLEHGLAGLDYLANEKLIHRDIKPDNLLYCDLGEGDVLIQLADFGLARHPTLATTFCGTGYYQAPELWPAYSKITAPQSPKMDIWSLWASIVDVHSSHPEFPPRGVVGYDTVLNTLKAAALRMPRLEAMARLHPERRASAAQLLVLLFNGKGLTTDRSQIPDIGPDIEETVFPPHSPSVAGPSNPRERRNSPGKAPPLPTAARPPLVVYPPRKNRPRAGPSDRWPPRPLVSANLGGNLAAHPTPLPQPNRVRVDGRVVMRQAAVGANALLRRPMLQKDQASFEEAGEDAKHGFALVGQLPQKKQPDLKRTPEARFKIPGMFPP